MIYIYTNQTAHASEYLEVVRLFLQREAVQCFALDEFDSVHISENTVTVNVQEAAGALITCCAYYAAGNADAVVTHAREDVLCDPSDALKYKRLVKRGSKNAVFGLMKKIYPDVSIPWGSLTGIRPTRLLRELLIDHTEAQAQTLLKETFHVRADKTDLLMQVYDVQKPIIAQHDERQIDVYCGIPFCATRCAYCSFASYPLGKYASYVDDYLSAMYKEMRLAADIIRQKNLKLRAVYVGGGTPTSLSDSDFEVFLAKLYEYYGGAEEVTVEAGRPDTLNEHKMSSMRRHGVGRISINPQSMVPDTLDIIGRGHTPEDVERAFDLARNAGFACINADVIMGLPGEGMHHAEVTLNAMRRLAPENLTVHTLAIKRASELREQIEAYDLPYAQTVERMVEMARHCAQDMNLTPYYLYRQKSMAGNLENVGYAKPGQECLYNVDIMEERISVMALGAGAITKRVYRLGELIRRQPNPKDLNHYIQNVDRHIERKRALFD